MSVVSFVADDRFTIRIVKALATNPDNRWANSYEAVASDASTTGDLVALTNAIVAFEKSIHQNGVQFLSALISTWEPDSVPYDPESFYTLPLTGTGGVGVVSDIEPLNTCLSVARVASSGRTGHLFYRGVLQEGDVESPSGKAALVDRDGFQDTIDGAITSTSLDDWFGPTDTSTLHLVMISASGGQVRRVLNFRVQGVSTVPTDHAWFNRGNPI
jgi:hypothetical protein